MASWPTEDQLATKIALPERMLIWHDTGWPFANVSRFLLTANSQLPTASLLHNHLLHRYLIPHRQVEGIGAGG